MKKSEIPNAFGDLMKYVFRTHSGVLIERRGGKFWVQSLKTEYPSFEDACYGIDKALKELARDIVKQNPQLCTPLKKQY